MDTTSLNRTSGASSMKRAANPVSDHEARTIAVLLDPDDPPEPEYSGPESPEPEPELDEPPPDGGGWDGDAEDEGCEDDDGDDEYEEDGDDEDDG